MAYITPYHATGYYFPWGRTHRHTRIPTHKPNQFQETRRMQPKATRAWIKNPVPRNLHAILEKIAAK